MALLIFALQETLCSIKKIEKNGNLAEKIEK